MPDVRTLQSGLGFVEGPVWNPATKELSLVSITKGCIYTLGEEGKIVTEVGTGGGPNGMVLAHDALYVAQNGGIFGGAGPASPGVQKVQGDNITDLFGGVFKAPNDLCFGPDGLLYVTDPASEKGIFEPVEGRLLVCDLAAGTCRVVAEDPLFPNGLAFDASGQHLYLAHTYSRLIERFSFRGGRLQSDGTFCQLANGRPDGMAIDLEGKLWVCTPGTGGLEVFSADGKAVRRIEFGQGTMTTNCCFGSDDLRTLYVAAAGSGSVLALPVDVPGLPLRDGRSDVHYSNASGEMAEPLSKRK